MLETEIPAFSPNELCDVKTRMRNVLVHNDKRRESYSSLSFTPSSRLLVLFLLLLTRCTRFNLRRDIIFVHLHLDFNLVHTLCFLNFVSLDLLPLGRSDVPIGEFSFLVLLLVLLRSIFSNGSAENAHELFDESLYSDGTLESFVPLGGADKFDPFRDRPSFGSLRLRGKLNGEACGRETVLDELLETSGIESGGSRFGSEGGRKGFVESGLISGNLRDDGSLGFGSFLLRVTESQQRREEKSATKDRDSQDLRNRREEFVRLRKLAFFGKR